MPVICSALHSTGLPDHVEWSNRRLAPLTDAFIAVAEPHARYLVEQLAVDGKGTLWLVATPIGTVGDLGERAGDLLNEVDVVLAATGQMDFDALVAEDDHTKELQDRMRVAVHEIEPLASHELRERDEGL